MADKLHYLGAANRGPRAGKLLLFRCPGCESIHPVEVEAPGGAGWTWNGSMDQPTFQPSLLCNQHDPGSRCHSFINNGRIQFLSDCHHALAGQTVDLPDWE